MQCISSGSVVRWCCSSTAVSEVRRWSGPADVAPELSWGLLGFESGSAVLYTIITFSMDLIVTTIERRPGKSFKRGELQANFSTDSTESGGMSEGGGGGSKKPYGV